MKIDFQKINRCKLVTEEDKCFFYIPISYTTDSKLVLQNTFLEYANVFDQQGKRELEFNENVYIAVFDEDDSEKNLLMPCDIDKLNYKEIFLKVTVNEPLVLESTYHLNITQTMEFDKGVVPIERVFSLEVTKNKQVKLKKVKRSNESILITVNFFIVLALLGSLWGWNEYYNDESTYSEYFPMTKDTVKIWIVFLTGFLGVHSYLIKLKSNFSFDYIANFFMFPEYVVEPNIVAFFKNKTTLYILTSILAVFITLLSMLVPIDLRRSQLPKELPLEYAYYDGNDLVPIDDMSTHVYRIFSYRNDSVVVKFKNSNVIYADLERSKEKSEQYNIIHKKYKVKKGAGIIEYLDFKRVKNSRYLINDRNALLERKFIKSLVASKPDSTVFFRNGVISGQELKPITPNNIKLFGYEIPRMKTLKYVATLNEELKKKILFTKEGKLKTVLLDSFSIRYRHEKHSFNGAICSQYFSKEFEEMSGKYLSDANFASRLVNMEMLYQYSKKTDFIDDFEIEHMDSLCSDFNKFVFNKKRRSSHKDQLQTLIQFMLEIEQSSNIDYHDILHTTIKKTINIHPKWISKSSFQFLYLIEIVRLGMLETSESRKEYFNTLEKKPKLSYLQSDLLRRSQLDEDEKNIVRDYFLLQEN